MIRYAIPGLTQHYKLLMECLAYLENNPQYKRENVEIESIYGNFPYCTWDGGRIFSFDNYYHSCYEDIEDIRDNLLKKNIALRLIFTNCELKEEHLKDRFCNLVCKLCENEKNEIVVNSPLLEQFLRENYPKYQFISSTTKCNNKTDTLAEIQSNKYKFVCLDYNLNHNKNFLENLTQEEKDKVEFLCNAVCPSGCPNRKEHYRLNSIFYLNGGTQYTIPCSLPDSTVGPQCMKYPNNISPEEIENYYEPMGFSMFKLEGRTLPDMEVLLNFIRYVVKPDCQMQMIRDLSPFCKPSV